MKDIAKAVYKKAKTLVMLGTCSICGGQLTGTLYILQAAGTVVISAYLTIFFNQKDCRQ